MPWRYDPETGNCYPTRFDNMEVFPISIGRYLPTQYAVAHMQRTGSRSSLSGLDDRLTRSSSRLSLSRSGSFGGGYFHRSASSDSLFGRSLRYSSSSSHIAPFQSVALQRSTPHYMDRYPYVRYSYGGNEAGLNLLAASNYSRASAPGSYSRYASSAYGSYTPPTRYTSYTAIRPYTAVYNPPSYGYGRGTASIDTALDWYKGRVMTVGTLSKYWLSPGSNTYASRRQRDAALNYVSPRDPVSSYRYNPVTRFRSFY